MTDNAEATVMGMLLLELTEALIERGGLKREDVAGALLRTEYRADMLDDAGAEFGNITRPHRGLARQQTEAWTKRLALLPEVYTLSKKHEEWLLAGGKGRPPLYPEAIIELSEDDGQP